MSRQPVVQPAFPENSQRGNTRIFYWGQGSSVGQLTIDYGQPLWQDKYDETLEGGQLDGRRWRLGQNFWTNLDTNISLTIGESKLDAGLYYMTLERNSDGEYWLAFLDPAGVRARKLDAYHAHKTEGGFEVMMAESLSDKKTSKLQIRLTSSGRKDHRATLRIQFGPHVLSAPVVMHPEEG